MKEIRMMTGGDAVDIDRLTATPKHVRAGDIFYGSGSDEEQTGTLTDRSVSTGITIDGKPIHSADEVKVETDSDGVTRIALSPPNGEYPGSGEAYVGVQPGDLGIEPEYVAAGHEMAGVTGSYGSDGDVAAKDIREGKIAYGSDGKVTGTATDYGNVSKIIGAGESYTINEGFYGSGKVTAKTLASQTEGTAAAADIAKDKTAYVNGAKVTGTAPTKEAETITPGTADITIAAGTHLNGAQTIKGDTNLVGGNIIPGKSIFGVAGAATSKGATTYTPGTSDQTIAKNQYLTGDQTIKGDSNLAAGNIKKGVSIFGKTGTWYGNKTVIAAMAARGFGLSSSDYETYSEQSFTMPADGMVYYGGANAGYYHTGVCQILKNGTVVDSRDCSSESYYSGWRGTMVNKQFSANKGDVIKVICSQTAGTHGVSVIQAVCVY